MDRPREAKITELDEGSVLLEYRAVGAYVKVSAIDPVTRTEVSIVGDRSRSEAALARIAVKKLKYVLAKRGVSGSGDDDLPG